MSALRKLLMGVFVALAFLALVEGALRVLDLPDRGLYDGDPASVWWLRPDLDRDVDFPEEGTRFHVRTNTAGFRGPLVEGGVACLGDSTTFGWGVDAAEAWPALLGEPALNAGVPGYSTVQGLATLDRVLALHPRLVVVAYLVRDAELSTHADDPTPRPPDLHLSQLLRKLRPARPAVGTVPRVSPAAYAANLRTIGDRARAAGAAIVYLAFPMVEPPVAHLDALRSVAADALFPVLDRAAFFPHDPIHLTPDGHRRLADWLRTRLPK